MATVAKAKALTSISLIFLNGGHRTRLSAAKCERQSGVAWLLKLSDASFVSILMDLVRLDKWLWATRVFKTRGLATDACRAGHVKIDGQSVKPAHTVRPGEIITAWNGVFTRTVKVLAPLENRVGAQLVARFLADLTPESERNRRTEPDFRLVPLAGKSRPTKKERRQLNEFKEQL